MQKGGRRHESEVIRAFDAQLVSRLVMDSLPSVSRGKSGDRGISPTRDYNPL